MCEQSHLVRVEKYVKKNRCSVSDMCHVCVHVCIRWQLHPSSLPSMGRATQRDMTPPRENLMARSAHWFRDQVTLSKVFSLM